jgi:hypothetical protein
VTDASLVSDRSRTGKSGPAANVARATEMPNVKAVVTSAAVEMASTVEVAAATMTVAATAVTATAVTATTPANRGARQRRRQRSNGNCGDQL